MRIALVGGALDTAGGTERVLHGFSGWLATRGHDVTVYCASSREVPAGVVVRPLGVRGPGRLARAWSAFRSSRAIPRADHDCVVAFGRTASHTVYRAGGGCHAAWLRARGGWRPEDPLDLWFDRTAIRAARLVVVNSEMAAADLVGHYGVDRGKLRLVRNGVDLQRFRPGAPLRSRPSVLFLGSGFRRKGLAAAIRAVAHMPGVDLLVAGRDARAPSFRREAARAGLGERFRLLGPRRDPETLLAEASALLLPTRYDPSANATIEALACGTPVVTTLRNGAAEVLPDAWMAVADPEDDEALAAALERALHEGEVGSLRARCRARAEQYPADAAFFGLESVVREVVV
jgi:UDP-glucose:(heptosyl)LPS alpha-1,3-glucosyltransferase